MCHPSPSRILCAYFLLTYHDISNLLYPRSVLSGEKDVMTMQIDAMFKNGTTPSNNKDWQRLFLGVLRRSFEIEDVKFLR
jgi:hypothetical protein